MSAIYGPVFLILDVAFFIMIAHIIMSWLISFQVLNLYQPLVAQIWTGLNRLLDLYTGQSEEFCQTLNRWIYRPWSHLLF